jgi:type I restriction enzyme S subunit
VLYIERFGDPATNPLRWPCLPFAALGDNQNVLRWREKSAESQTGAYPLYGASGEVRRLEQATFNGERLLVAEDGANLLTRQQPVARVMRGDFAVNQHSHVIATTGRADLYYLAFAIELTELKPYLTGVTAPKLKRMNLERIVVPVPPLELQGEFRAAVEKVEQLGSILLTSSQRLDELFAALRQRAFAGALQFK